MSRISIDHESFYAYISFLALAREREVLRTLMQRLDEDNAIYLIKMSSFFCHSINMLLWGWIDTLSICVMKMCIEFTSSIIIYIFLMLHCVTSKLRYNSTLRLKVAIHSRRLLDTSLQCCKKKQSFFDGIIMIIFERFLKLNFRISRHLRSRNVRFAMKWK